MKTTARTTIATLILVRLIGILAPSAAAAPEITVAGATAKEAEIVEWALERYAEAGLVLPSIEITFHADKTGCQGNQGLYRDGEGRNRIDICTRAAGHDIVPKSTVLHEIAHAWAHRTLTEDERNDFNRLRNVSVWSSNDVDTWERGTEHAAEIITWGLMDQLIKIVRITGTDCDALHAGFVQLAGIAPPYGLNCR